MKRFKSTLNDHVFMPFADYLDQEMRHFGDGVNQLISAKQRFENAYNKEVVLRRRYFNEIQELKGNIRVFCRIRPLLPDEMEAEYTMKVRSLDRYQVHIEKVAK